MDFDSIKAKKYKRKKKKLTESTKITNSGHLQLLKTGRRAETHTNGKKRIEKKGKKKKRKRERGFCAFARILCIRAHSRHRCFAS